MSFVTVNRLRKAFTQKDLFHEVQLGVEIGEKVGLIGLNGSGKSTLLKIIAGLEECDEGEVVTEKNTVIRYLPQNPVFERDMSLFDYVTNYYEQPCPEGEAKAMLNRLGFSDYSAAVTQLSGGQRKKAALAAVLLSPGDFLLLDEPTNHLDHTMTEWLEEYLKNYRGAVLMITHDRYFLDLVCSRILELEEGELVSYRTNYEGYLELKAQRMEMAYASQRKKQTLLKKEIAWMQRGARARSTKQKAHIARYEDLAGSEWIKEAEQLRMSSISSRLGGKTIEFLGVSKGYGNRQLIRDFNYLFLKTDRIGVVGINGCGKTTLLKMIAGDCEPDSGRIEIGETVKIGYYKQENEALPENSRVIDYMKETAEYVSTAEGNITASKMLERFLFDDSLQYAKIGNLSGGEKRRLYLLKILMEAPNVLILDEPTNDLDIQTLCVLEDYLDSFEGIVIAVSHDRYFLDRVARRLLAFEADGTIRQFEGSYTEYFMQIKDSGEQKEERKQTNSGKEEYKREKAGSRKLKFTFLEQKEYESIEAEIDELEREHEACNSKMLECSNDFVELNRIVERKEEIEKKLEEKLERYLYLEELAESIRQQNDNIRE